MSFATLGTTESQDSTANDDENDDFAPQPVTGRYLSTQALHRLVKEAIGAHPHITMNDTDVVAVKWANAIEARLYTDDGCLGELQGETSYTTDEFKEAYGDSITTDHADLTQDERSELTELFNDSDKDVSALQEQFKLPVINGDRLPLLVADEDVFEEGIEMLDAMMAEFDNDASSTESDVEFPILEGTIPDLKTWLDSKDPVPDKCEQMLEAEKAGKDRKGAKAALEAFLPSEDEGSTTDESEDEESDETEANDETDDDEGASSTEGGLSDEQIEKVATATATAVASTLSEMDF